MTAVGCQPQRRTPLKAVGGRIDQAGGIAVRLEECRQLTMWRAPTRWRINVRFYRRLQRRREQL